jgi:hypothetical protein
MTALNDYKKLIPETQILRSILAYLESKGILAWRINTGALKRTKADGTAYYCKFGTVGMADIFGLIPQKNDFAIPFFIEVKRYGQKLKPHQQAFIDSVKAKGAIAGMATSIDDVSKLIDTFIS